MSIDVKKISNFILPKKPFHGRKIEADFTTWFGRNIKNNGGHFWKLSDMDIRKKPYDAIMTYAGLDAKIEFKQSNHKKKLDICNMLLPNQVIGLREVQKNGGLALVIYYNTTHNIYRVMEYKEKLPLIIQEFL